MIDPLDRGEPGWKDVGMSPTRQSFMEELRTNLGEPQVSVAERIFDWTLGHGFRESYAGRRPDAGDGFIPVVKGISWEPTVIGFSSRAEYVYLQGDPLRRHNPYKIDAAWQEVLDAMYTIPAVIRTELGYYPHVSLTALADQPTWNPFFAIIERIVQRLKRSTQLGLE